MNTITLKWINKDVELPSANIVDGKYIVNLVDEKQENLNICIGNFELVKIGKITKINLVKSNGQRLVYTSFKTKAENIKILKKAETIKDVVKKFLLSKCADIKKIMDISDFTTDEKVCEKDEDENEDENDEIIEVENEEDATDKNVGRKRTKKHIEKPNKTNKPNKPNKTEDEIDEEITEINFQMLERFVGRNFPVKCNIQSSKTKFIISSAIWFLLNGKSSLIILRNYTADSDQLKTRIKQFTNELYNSLEHFGFSRNLFPIEFADDDKITPESLNGTTPKILISIYNNASLNKINKKIGENEKGKFVLFIDEADMLHKDVEVTETTKNGDLTVASELQSMINTCFCSFSVSGTILDAIMKKNIKIEDLIVLEPPTGYRSHNSFLIEHLRKKCKFTTLENEDVILNDENILPFLDKFKTLTPYKTLLGDDHPNYCLMRVSKVKKPMRKFFNMMCTDYRSIVCLLYTGEEIKLHHDSLGNVNSIRLSNGRSSQNIKGVHIFQKGASPGHILEWLKNNGGVEKFPHLITIAGDLASRGISFGSADFSKCQALHKLPWHLTSMYSTFAETTDIPEILQITGRLCTIVFDGVPLTLHITPKDHENLLKGYNITEEFVTRAAKLKERKTSIKEYISGLSIFKNKVPSSDRSLTKFTKFTPKKVSTLEEDVNNGGWVTDERGRYIVRVVQDENGQKLSNITKDGPIIGTIIEGADHPEPDDYDVIDIKRKVAKDKNKVNEDDKIPKNIIDESIKEIGEEEYLRLTKKMFPKWSTGNTKISIFMHNLDPNKVYTEKEFRELCKTSGINRLRQIMIYKNTIGHGNIIKEYNNNYKLHVCLQEEFRKYF